MATLTIEVEERLADALQQLAASHGGDMAKALEELIAIHAGLELMADEFELANAEGLRQQRLQSEQDFAAGRVVDWKDLKRRNQL